jgi:hypothetical protein
MSGEPFISERGREQWAQWSAEYREKIAPSAAIAGVGPDAFFLGYMINWARMSLDDVEKAVRALKAEDPEPWQRGKDDEEGTS